MKNRVAVLGFGVTGQSVVRHLLRSGLEPVVLDTRPARAVDCQDVEFIWDATRWPGLDVAAAVVSPGLDLDSCLVAGARVGGIELLSDIDLFFAAVTAPVIGITGTNGKSTVTSLVGHLLTCSGMSCGVGGNLGDAALDVIDPAHECYVLELSSFQLERSAEHAYHVATILNVSEDHLDKHASMARYAASKQRIYPGSKRCIYNRSDPMTLPGKESGKEPGKEPGAGASAISFGLDAPVNQTDWGICHDAGQRYLSRGQDLVCAASTLTLKGAHNEQNALAACALVDGWVASDELAGSIGSFTGLAHRFNTVADVDRVTFVDDSKATNLGATIAALGGMPAANQVVLIAGGDAKGVDLSPLIPLLKGRVKQLVTLGQDGPQLIRIAALANIPAVACSSMADAVQAAKLNADPGDTVLLSPACSSLDMFASFAERGAQFTEAAQQVADNNSGDTA